MFRFCSALLLVGLCSLALMSAHAAPLKIPQAQVVAQWSPPAPVTHTQWSPKGDKVLYQTQRGTQASLWVYQPQRRKQRKVDTHRDAFWPCFGPADTIFGGMAKDTPLTALQRKALAAQAKRRKEMQRRQGKANSHTAKRPAPKTKGATQGKAALSKSRAPKPRRSKPRALVSKGQTSRVPAKKRRGVTIFGMGQRSYLFPGVRPRYSFAARRLLFRHRGILYLWDPLKNTRRGLMMLTTGYGPRWSLSGRAIAYTASPFRIAQGKASGGGIRIVDMLFRATRLSKKGGQLTWGPNNKSIAFVAPAPNAKAEAPQYGVYWRPLSRKGKREYLAPGGQHPHILPDRRKAGTLLAYHDKKGVWVMQLRSRKKKLLVKGGTHPQWSSQGDLLVRYHNALLVLRLAPILLRTLDKL